MQFSAKHESMVCKLVLTPYPGAPMPNPHPGDFTIEYRQRPDGSITDFRVTRGKALYRPPWWQRWLMPWRWVRFLRQPLFPFPKDKP